MLSQQVNGGGEVVRGHTFKAVFSGACDLLLLTARLSPEMASVEDEPEPEGILYSTSCTLYSFPVEFFIACMVTCEVLNVPWSLLILPSSWQDVKSFDLCYRVDY